MNVTSLAKILVIALAATATQLLGAAGARAEPVPPMLDAVAPVSHPVTTEPTPSPETLEQVFVVVIRDKIPRTQHLSHDEVVKLGTDICESIDDAGGSVIIVAVTELDNGADPEELGYLIGASIFAFCPRYTEEMEDLADLGD